MTRSIRASAAFLTMALIATGCFYPPITAPPSDDKQRVIIPLPYDLAWDAVNHVVQDHGMHVQAQDPNHGIIEAVGQRFTLHDADCGKIKSVAGTYTAEPELNGSSVYNFLVRPHGKEASAVEVRGTFNSPVKVPLRPAKDVDCVSHGIQESNLLREVLVEAARTHRPVFPKPSEATAPENQPAISADQTSSSTLPGAGRSTIEKPERFESGSRFSLGGDESLRIPKLPDSPPASNP